jgi:hypothetical protein
MWAVRIPPLGVRSFQLFGLYYGEQGERSTYIILGFLNSAWDCSMVKAPAKSGFFATKGLARVPIDCALE